MGNLRLADAIGEVTKKLESATAAIKENQGDESRRRLRRQASRLARRRLAKRKRLEVNAFEPVIVSDSHSDDSSSDK